MKRGMSPATAEKLLMLRGNAHGTRLRRLRVEKGLSQSDLAEKSGIPIKTIQRFEQNTTPIDGVKLNTLCDLCLALNCGIGDILESAELKEKFNKVKGGEEK